jgi:hypothetical protein
VLSTLQPRNLYSLPSDLLEEGKRRNFRKVLIWRAPRGFRFLLEPFAVFRRLLFPKLFIIHITLKQQKRRKKI